MTKDLERQIEWDEFDKIIHVAETLQHIQERNEELREAYAELQPIQGDLAPLTLEILYQTTNNLEINSEFVDKAISLHYPSKKQQRKILEKHKANPTREVLMESYRNRLIPLVKETIPYKRFKIKKNYWGLMVNEMRDMDLPNKLKTMWREDLPPTCLFGEIPRGLAYLEFPNISHVNIKLFSPLFLKICEETLGKLQKEFKTKHHYTYHHNPHD